jgi:hypothetical protein
MTDKTPDFIALILLGAGGAFGRAADPAEAINIARREAGQFARPFGGFKRGATLNVGIYDVTGMGDLAIGHDGVHDTTTATAAPFVRIVKVPAKGKPFTAADYKGSAN